MAAAPNFYPIDLNSWLTRPLAADRVTAATEVASNGTQVKRSGAVMREVVVDTETTGLEPAEGHRLVEIGALELVNHLPTGRVFHSYLNPERDMPAEALQVHGLTSAFLEDQPVFAEVVDALLQFLDSDGESNHAPARLVIHNAAFDLAFLNSELERSGRPVLDGEHVDTLALARQRFPGASVSLDALCRRFAVDASARTRHGALLDSELLAEVYLGLIGGRQPDLALVQRVGGSVAQRARERVVRPARPHAPSPAELVAHEAFLAQLSSPIWRS
jgi:DNA polymerase-3 subunit epsilon